MGAGRMPAPGGKGDTQMSTYVLRQNQRIDFTNIKFDDTKTDGLIFQGGTETVPLVADVAGSKFLSFYCDNGATSGDNRLMYLRLFLTGGAGGEAARIYTNVDANCATAHGAHISLDFAATAGGSECSGLGVANRCTLHIPNVASWAPTGTYAAIQAEIYSDGTNSDPAGMTELSFIRFANSGGSGKADVDTDAYLFSLQGFTETEGSVVNIDVPGSLAASLKILIGSTPYYIGLYSSHSD